MAGQYVAPVGKSRGNQGWDEYLGFADDNLQSLAGWLSTWDKLPAGGETFYRAYVTDLTIPFN